MLTECARLALDTTEATQEDISLYSFPMKSPAERRGSKARALLQQIGRTSSPIVPSSKIEIVVKLNVVNPVAVFRIGALTSGVVLGFQIRDGG